MDKEERLFFLKTAHFWDNYLFIRSKNVKTSPGPYLEN